MKKTFPVGNRLLVKPHPSETKTASGIIVPEQKGTTGDVIEVGKEVESGIKVGDKIMYQAGRGVVPINIEGEEYLIINENEILAIYE